MKRSAFSADWLARRLGALLPNYPDVSICVALSGGLDSVVLLTALIGRGRKRLRAVHVHHGLHPNAYKWSAHCNKIAAQLGVPLTVLRVKVARPRGTSLEAAARDARYEALANALEPGEVLLTAHHEDDQLETVLLQLMRGTGIAGLAAMPEVAPFAQGQLVRPLLTRSRTELEAWAVAQELTWVEDDTNADEQLDRNYLRRRVLPLIRERWPSAAPSVARTARHAAEAKRLLDSLALADVERAANGAALSVQSLRLLSPDRRRNALRFWIARAGHPLPDTRRLDELAGPLLAARPDANPRVEWNGTTLQRHADTLTLERSRPGASRQRKTARVILTQTEIIEWDWRAHPRLGLGGTRGSLALTRDANGPIDLDAIPETVTVRSRNGGERLRLSATRPTRTLKSLLQEARVPLADREQLPLLYNGAHLIAAADRWLDASLHATETTRNRARLTWHR